MVAEEKRLCGSGGLPPCKMGETCVHDAKGDCNGALDCPGVCTTKKICATLAGLQCDKGEKCVDDVGNTDCRGGIAADCPGVCQGLRYIGLNNIIPGSVCEATYTAHSWLRGLSNKNSSPDSYPKLAIAYMKSALG